MKPYFCNSFLEGCYYVRCLMPMIAGGWNGDKTSLRGEANLPEVRSKATLDADIVIFHRPGDDRSLQVAKLLRKAGKKIVMDNDDTYKGIDAQKLGKTFVKVDQAIDEFIPFADMVTCSTEYLAKEYRKLSPNVVVLPNCVDPDDWPEPLRNEGDKVRIGLVGTVVMNDDYKGVKGVLKHLSSRDDVQLVVFGLPPKIKETEKVQFLYRKEYKFWESLNIDWQPFVKMEEYFDTLNGLRLDIMFIPRNDDYFNRCKSNLKFLEASMLEIPTVAQGFKDGNSPYQGKTDSKFMDVVIGDKWMEALEPLIKDKKLRRHKGRLAKDYVLNNYNIHDNVWKWEASYKSLLDK